MAETPKIYAALVAVMDEVGAVGKNGTNTQQNYKFRGIDDVLAATQHVMAKHRVLCIPKVLEREREYIDTRNGGKMASVRLLVKFTFYADDGSFVESVTLGEAMDSGDKATNKAMATALKYCLTMGLLMPTREDGIDTETASPEMSGKKAPAQRDAKSTDDLEKEKALILATAQAARTPGDIDALRSRFSKLPKPDRDELEPKLKARKAELTKVTP
jgi:ERF superfamily